MTRRVIDEDGRDVRPLTITVPSVPNTPPPIPAALVARFDPSFEDDEDS